MEEWKITLVGVKKEDMGSDGVPIELEVDDEFIEWFKKEHGLTRWSEKKFGEWFSKTLRSMLSSINKKQSPQKNKYEYIYDRKKGYGSLEDIQPGDIISYFWKGGPQFTREVRKVLKNGVSTEPLAEGKAAEKVKFIDIVEIQRKI